MLDYDQLVKGRFVVPGNPDESKLWDRVKRPQGSPGSIRFSMRQCVLSTGDVMCARARYSRSTFPSANKR